MKFGLLADDPALIPLIAALNASAQHRLTLAARCTPAADVLLHHATEIKFCESWEELLIDRDVDAVIVGGSAEVVQTGMKQLASAGKPILLFPTAAQTSTLIYELTLIRDENRVQLAPAWLARFHPRMVALKQQLARGELGPSELGTVRLWQFERQLPAATGTLSVAAVEAALLNDIDLLRSLGGNYDQITAIRSGDETAGVLLETVVFAAAGLAEARWSIQPGPQPQWTLSIHTDRGITRLTSHDFPLESRAVPGMAADPQLVAAGERVLDEFASLVGGQPSSLEWPAVIRAFEIVEATQRSLRRRRTIELHFEGISERAQFKTQMTAIGCGVLMGTLFLMLIYLAIASVIPLGGTALQLLRALVFAPLAIFLLAQLLLPLAKPGLREITQDDADSQID